LAAVYALSDRPKPEARAMVERLSSRGIRVAMITGDHRATAEAVGRELGISQVVSEVMPQDKVREVQRLQESGPVLFVGDGINDAPSLAQADVGMALATGQDIAVEAGDVILVGGALDRVPDAVGLGRRTRRIIFQNLWWALGYNLLLIPAAAGALFLLAGVALTPMMASVAMALSSITVVSNSLRLRR
jgi:Cu+-exporting ATPase